MSASDSIELLATALVDLASDENRQIDLVSLTFESDTDPEETIVYKRRTEDTNLVSIIFDDNTVYDLAVSIPLYDSLKGALETCEDFQDVIGDTVIDDTPTDETQD